MWGVLIGCEEVVTSGRYRLLTGITFIALLFRDEVVVVVKSLDE
jgi:hypothetical protein